VIDGLVRAWLLATVAIAVAAGMLPGMAVHGGVMSLFLVAAPIALARSLANGLMRGLAIPCLAVASTFVVWAVDTTVVLVTDALSRRLEVDGWWAAVWAAELIAVAAGAVSWLVDPASA
jgi:uncharacterized membrane protein YvlD (DUF360 family)